MSDMGGAMMADVTLSLNDTALLEVDITAVSGSVTLTIPFTVKNTNKQSGKIRYGFAFNDLPTSTRVTLRSFLYDF
jgi:DUF4097 and DUF4098 domain-containing protein YvlB